MALRPKRREENLVPAASGALLGSRRSHTTNPTREARVPENQRSEQELLAFLRSGDEAAFASLVDQLHGRLLAVAGTFTSSPALAEDIVQETWFAVIRGL